MPEVAAHGPQQEFIKDMSRGNHPGSTRRASISLKRLAALNGLTRINRN